MSGVATAIAATALGGIGSTAYSARQSNKANKSAQSRLDALQYQEDPLYTKSQEELSTLGSGLLKGEVPDYFKAIGESGSSEFENMLGLTTRDILKASAESTASQGTARGGNLAAITAGRIGDATTQLRYEDYNRALGGKQYLLGLGADITSGVRGAAQGNQSEKNALEQYKTGAYNQIGYNQAQSKSNAVAGYSSALQSIIGGVAGMGSGGQSGSMLSQLFSQYGNGAGSSGRNQYNTYLTGVSSLGSIQQNNVNSRSNGSGFLSSADVSGRY